MTSVLVTGGRGFIGRHVVAELERRSYDVHLTTSDSRAAGERVHAVDLLKPGDARRLIEALHPSFLIHLAWFTRPGAFWTAPENVRWVEASLGLLRAFAEHGGRRAVMAGSCAEYDWSTGDCVEGVTPERPSTLYGACKLGLRIVAEAAAARAGVSLAWGRVFFPYGPGESREKLVAAVAAALAAGEPVALSEGNQRRDFLHVIDVARAFVQLLESSAEGAVNIGSGTAVAVREVAQRLAELEGRPDLLEIGRRPQPAGDPPLIRADVRRLREEVGFSPSLDLEAGLRETLTWWRAGQPRRRSHPLGQ